MKKVKVYRINKDKKKKSLSDVLSDEKMKEIVCDICDETEYLLEDYNIMIPDDDRTYDESEACLFGESYYRLEDSIKSILENIEFEE